MKIGQARKIEEEKAKETEDICNGAIVIIMQGIQTDQEKVRTRCDRKWGSGGPRALKWKYESYRSHCGIFERDLEDGAIIGNDKI